MILLVGATGRVGGVIARLLLAQGKAVRTLVRPQSNYQSLALAGAEPVFGDVRNEASLRKACAGVDTVITTASAAGREGVDTIESVDLFGSRQLIVAARDAWVRHMIFISASAAHPNHANRFLAAKGKTEVNLRASGMPYTILAPTMLAEVWPMQVVARPAQAGRPVTVVGSGARRHAFISGADVAAFAAAAVDNPRAMNRRLALCGPTGHSYNEVVGMVEYLTGCRPEIEHVAPGAPVWGLNDDLAELLALQDTYDSVWDMAETAAAFGVQLTPLEEVLRHLLLPAPINARTLEPMRQPEFSLGF